MATEQKVFNQRLKHTAEALNEYYVKFIDRRKAEDLSEKTILNYKNLLTLCIVQGMQLKVFSVDQWWKAQKTFPPDLLKATKPLNYLELKLKNCLADGKKEEAAYCLKEFKRVGRAVSVVVFKDLFGKNQFFTVHDNKIYYREDTNIL